ncbi:MAG: hypothetical protein HC838_08490, partial [Spirulinaceae cyanobacterium RM2_2_10]|nr:hypothetical protein [Spirulinaceae cyanobacterium RM2_2_10]
MQFNTKLLAFSTAALLLGSAGYAAIAQTTTQPTEPTLQLAQAEPEQRQRRRRDFAAAAQQLGVTEQ